MVLAVRGIFGWYGKPNKFSKNTIQTNFASKKYLCSIKYKSFGIGMVIAILGIHDEPPLLIDHLSTRLSD